VQTPRGDFPISSQHYTPGVTSPDGASRICEFETDPWPRWVFDLGDGIAVTQEIFVPRGMKVAVVVWRVRGERCGLRLQVRPLLSGRDYHSMHHENGGFDFSHGTNQNRITWKPYGEPTTIHSLANADYTHAPAWYRNFEYAEERSRGLDFIEDLASPGILTWDLSHGDAFWVLARPGALESWSQNSPEFVSLVEQLSADEKLRRAALGSPLDRAAEAYLIRRGLGWTIAAGYPWFTDWGRDTFIALRGLCLATGRLEMARDILLSWTGAISQGMLPNRFPDQGETPEFNSVDASLWFVVAVHDFTEAASAAKFPLSKSNRKQLVATTELILAGYAEGTRHGIRSTADGLLACGEPGVQLTWMDAKVGDWVVTPRTGKPVEIQALWLNALWIGIRFGATRWQDTLDRGLAAFEQRFWNEDVGCLYDVVDVDHAPGRLDAAVRPNQIFAVGGLPFQIVQGERARGIVATVEDQLLTPLGLRSLSPRDQAYRASYNGGVWERDGAYHQGTVWPWLIGAFVEAWLRVSTKTPKSACAEAEHRFLEPFLNHLDTAGIGHVSEITDAEYPHSPKGCPWQAWSVGELLRARSLVSRLPSPVPPVSASPKTKTSGKRIEKLSLA
jgi:predicted glycogen debranching enzyme